MAINCANHQNITDQNKAAIGTGPVHEYSMDLSLTCGELQGQMAWTIMANI
jgi:hypothetical protein